MQRCHTYKIAVSKYQGRCEQRSEVFVGWGVGVGLGGQSGCERRIEVFVKIQKKNFLGGGGVGGGGGRLGGGSGEGSGWM